MRRLPFVLLLAATSFALSARAAAPLRIWVDQVT
jgi:hypothetical protein